MEEKITVHIAAFEDLKRQVLQRQRLADDDSNLALVEAFNAKVADLSKKHKEAGNKRFQNHPKYKSFKQKTWHVNHPDELMPGDEEGDGMIVKPTQEVNLKCPITRTLMEQPVTNKGCQHSYSKAAIMELVKKSRGQTVGCPVSGCPGKVTLRSLEANHELEELIAKKREEEAECEEEEDEDVIDVD